MWIMIQNRNMFSFWLWIRVIKTSLVWSIRRYI